MRRIIFLLTVCVGLYYTSQAQDYSRHGLMEIKDQSEAARLDWNKAFDQAVETKNFKGLAKQRQALEQFMDLHLNNMRKLAAQGDARALLTAVDNYLQIQKQYIKNIMIPAESLDGNDPEAIEKVNSQTVEFMQKERIFLMEINNALAASTEPDVPVADPKMDQDDEEMEGDEEEEDVKAHQTSVVGDRPKAKKRTKLPHEAYNEDSKEGEKLREKNRKIKERNEKREEEAEERDEEEE